MRRILHFPEIWYHQHCAQPIGMVTPQLSSGVEKDTETLLCWQTLPQFPAHQTHMWCFCSYKAWAWNLHHCAPKEMAPTRRQLQHDCREWHMLVSIVSTVLTTGSYLTSPLSSCLHTLVCIPKLKKLQVFAQCGTGLIISASLWLVGRPHLYSLQIQICWGAPVWYDKSRCCCR